VVLKYSSCEIRTWLPVIEPDFGQERFLTDEPAELFKRGEFSKVPVIIGRSENEFANVAASEMMLKLLNF
jgi:carboxylesterase type B